MRNLLAHPITYEEVWECLERLLKDSGKVERMADMDPLLLKTAAAIVLAASECSSWYPLAQSSVHLDKALNSQMPKEHKHAVPLPRKQTGL